jgi:AcrR family transcriptional regulator
MCDRLYLQSVLINVNHRMGKLMAQAAARFRAAAIEAFAEQGYGATSTRDIANRLGLSTAAMYPHYKSKESLLYAISLDGHQSALHELERTDQPQIAPPDRLRLVVSAFTCWQANNSVLARVLQYEIRSLTPEHYKDVATLRRATSAVIGTIIETGSISGDFTVTDTDGVLLAISSLCVDVCRWFPSRTHSDPDLLGELYADIALRIVT